MTTASGQCIPLFISKSKLGWLKVQPLASSDPQAITAVQEFNAQQPTVAVIGDGLNTSVGMPKPKQLRGVELLRKAHITSGHASLRPLLIALKARGLLDGGRVTKEDVDEFIRLSLPQLWIYGLC